MGLLGVALLACKKGPGQPCLYNKDCKDNLVCFEDKCADVDQARATCAASEGCKVGARCGISSVAAESVASCLPTTEEHCKQSTNCTEKGYCKLNPGMLGCSN